MSFLYWITVLGNLGELSIFLTLLFGLGIIVSLFAAYANRSEATEDTWNKETRMKFVERWKASLKWAKITGICTVVFIIMSIMIPTKKELYFIYGVGTTIDYLKENKTAQGIPDKAVMAIDKWLDMTIEETNDTIKITK